MDRPTKTRSPTPPSVSAVAARVAEAFAAREERAGVRFGAPLSVAELSARYGGEFDASSAAQLVSRVAPVELARAGDVAPLTARRYLAAALASEALILADPALAPLIPASRRLTHESAALALAKMLRDAALSLAEPPGALIDPTAVIGPGAVVMAGAMVGPHATVEPNAVIYGGVVIGARVIVGAGSVVGRPGFGFARGEAGEPFRVPQLGGVHLEDDVELGPLCTIDAGTLGPTVIGRCSKLDAQVHVGHNARVGAFAMIAAQSGFAGSVELGVGVLVGGQVGVADHVRVGDGARLAAKSGVIGDVPAHATVAGYPAVDRARWLRATARLLDARPQTANRPGSPPKKNERR